jgi:hypothetical protein
MDTINVIRPYLEILYFVSAIVLAIVAIVALKQLSISKNTLTTQSKRDALKLTASECTRYLDQIIPLANDLEIAVKKYDVKYFNGWEVAVDRNNVTVTRKQPLDLQNFDKLVSTLVPLCNSLEGFATFFVSGVADEYLAYHTVGTTFLGTMDTLIPWVAGCQKDGYYKNLFHLYAKWKMRKQEALLRQKKESLEKQLNQMGDKRSYPLGVDKT